MVPLEHLAIIFQRSNSSTLGTFFFFLGLAEQGLKLWGQNHLSNPVTQSDLQSVPSQALFKKGSWSVRSLSGRHENCIYVALLPTVTLRLQARLPLAGLIIQGKIDKIGAGREENL